MIQDIFSTWGKYYYVFIDGIKWTFALTVITMIFGLPLGAVISFMNMSKNKVLNGISGIYVGLIRGTPFLLQLYFFWLWLPKVVPFEMSERQSIIVALIISSSAYVSEIIRAGIQAVDAGQWEAAKSLGIRNSYTMRYIIMPQAIKNILPALGNQFITMLKETSLASIFFVGELMTAWKTVQNATYQPLPALVIVGIIYLIMTYTLTFVLKKYERRLAESDS